MTDETVEPPPPNYEQASAAFPQQPPTWIPNNANMPFQGFTPMPPSLGLMSQQSDLPFVQPTFSPTTTFLGTNGAFLGAQPIQMTGIPSQQNPYLSTFPPNPTLFGLNQSTVMPSTPPLAQAYGMMQQTIPAAVQNGDYVTVSGPTSVHTKIVNGTMTANVQRLARTPVDLVCQFCNELVTTVAEEVEIKGDAGERCCQIYCLLILALMPIFWPCLCLALYEMFQDGVKHSCPRCQACIGVHYKLTKTGFAYTRDQALNTIARNIYATVGADAHRRHVGLSSGGQGHHAIVRRRHRRRGRRR